MWKEVPIEVLKQIGFVSIYTKIKLNLQIRKLKIYVIFINE